MNHYEVKAAVTIYAHTQAEALKIVEERLQGGYKRAEDPNALLIQECNVKLAKVGR